MIALANTSVEPPAGKDKTTLMGFFGQSLSGFACAKPMQKLSKPTDAIVRNEKNFLMFIILSFGLMGVK
jgi:hypothetical protein